MIIRSASLLPLLAAFLFASCQAPTASSNTPSDLRPAANTDRLAEPQANDPSLNWTDPCAVNLGRVVEALLLHYSQHHHLPETLAELPKKSLDGEPISLTCPASGKPYQYFAQGFEPPVGLIVTGVRLILYDAQPVHERILKLTDGRRDVDIKQKVRLGIVMVPPGRPGAAPSLGGGNSQTPANEPMVIPPTSAGGLQLYVVPIEQNLLDAYLKAPQRLQILPSPAPEQ
jgi:hypothetical protein